MTQVYHSEKAGRILQAEIEWEKWQEVDSSCGGE